MTELRLEQDLAALRAARGLSQAQLARLLGVSQPAVEPDGWTGCGTSRSVWIDTNHLPSEADSVTFFTSPSTSRLLR